MTFLYPAALAFAALVPVIVVLYMLRKKRRTVTVPSVLLWRELVERAPQHRALGRIRGLLSLLLNLLVFLLVLLALMRPDFADLFTVRHTVLVLDTRARMQAVGADGTSAFERAQRIADQVVQRAGDRHVFAILGGDGTTIAPFTADARRLRDLIAATRPTDAGGDLASTVNLAAKLVRAVADSGRLIVLTDRPQNFASEEGIEVETAAVGETADNVGIAEFALRSAPGGPQSLEVFLRVENFSATLIERDVEIRLDGELIDVVRARAEAGEAFETVIAVAAGAVTSPRGWLTATLTGRDALAVDDTARAVVPTTAKPRVLLITTGNWFLEKALAADESIAFELLGPDAWRDGMESAFDVVVFDDWLPPDATPALLERGNFLFAGRSPLGAEDPDIVNPVVTDVDARTPLLHGIDLAPSRVTSAYRLDPAVAPGRVAMPVRSADDALVATFQSAADPTRRSVVFAFRVADSDLPLRIAFPLLVSNSIHWLSGRTERGAAQAGRIVVLADEESLASEPGESGENGATSAGVMRVDRNGFYALRSGDATSWLAVNTSDAAESDLRAAETAVNPTIAGAAFLGMIPWRWLVVAALAVSLFEWLAFHRRWTE